MEQKNNELKSENKTFYLSSHDSLKDSILFQKNTLNHIIIDSERKTPDYKNDNNWKYTFDNIVAIGSENSLGSTWIALGVIIVLAILMLVYKLRNSSITEKRK